MSHPGPRAPLAGGGWRVYAKAMAAPMFRLSTMLCVSPMFRLSRRRARRFVARGGAARALP